MHGWASKPESKIGAARVNMELCWPWAALHLVFEKKEVTRPGLEPGISGSGGRRLIH